MDDIDLIKLAMEAKNNAHAVYSNYNVGAALLTKEGKVFTGCNIECSSYGISLCAERVALVKAVSEGYTEFTKIAVVGGHLDECTYTTPCGACRQFLSDFNNCDMDVIMGYKENEELISKTFKLKELLPENFEL